MEGIQTLEHLTCTRCGGHDFIRFCRRCSEYKASKDKVLSSFREDRLIEAFERYISQYGPGYSSTDTRAFDDAKAILAAVKQRGN